MFDALFDAGVAFLVPQTVWVEHLGRVFVDEGVAFSDMDWAGWQAGWLGGWLASWLAGCLAGSVDIPKLTLLE